MRWKKSDNFHLRSDILTCLDIYVLALKFLLSIRPAIHLLTHLLFWVLWYASLYTKNQVHEQRHENLKLIWMKKKIDAFFLVIETSIFLLSSVNALNTAFLHQNKPCRSIKVGFVLLPHQLYINPIMIGNMSGKVIQTPLPLRFKCKYITRTTSFSIGRAHV